MTSATLQVVERGTLPKGTQEYENKRSEIVNELGSKIPESLHLPLEIIEKPPLDVTNVFGSCGLLSQHEIEITEKYDAVALAQAIAEGKLTAVEVATAFSKRAAIAHQLTACLTDWFMDEAIERATYLDEYYKTNGKTIGPLHGVPISVKEHIPLRGRHASWGMLATRTMCSEDCLTTAIFRAAGAVFYCKTNQPQEIMHLESDSFYGRTLNPFNIDLTPGGSSGGESALLACRGSVLGIGTDIGGSIRCPAGFCGLYGFKPTAYTLTMKDHLPGGFPAELNILASVGPMCHSLRDCDLFVRVMKAADQHLLDTRVVPTLWTGIDTPINFPLKIGIMKCDGFIVPQPPVLKALAWAEEKLYTASNVVLKSFQPFEAATAWHRIRKAYFPESALPLKDLLRASGEPLFPLTKEIIQYAEDDKERTATEIMKMRWERDNFRSDFAKHWTAQDVDYILCPVYNGPACAHDTSFNWNYTAFWNYVDCPAIVVPTPIKASATKEQYPAEFAEPIGDEDKLQRKLWEETDFVGAPITLQLVARKWFDNQLFGALAALKDVLELP